MVPAHGVALKDYQKGWFYLAVSVASLMAFNGGWINAIAFTDVWKAGLTHLTGLTTNSAIRVVIPAAPGQITLFQFLVYIFGFYCGAAVVGFMISAPRLRWGRLQGAAVVLHGIAILSAWAVSGITTTFSGWLITFAMGGQNAVSSLFAGMGLRTSHITGHVLDIGIAVGQILATQSLTTLWRIDLNLPVFAAFWLGAICGVSAHNAMQVDALLVNAISTILVGAFTIVVCTLYGPFPKKWATK